MWSLKNSKSYGDTLDDFLFSPSSDWYMYQLFPAAVSQVVYLNNPKHNINFSIEQTVIDSEREKAP